MFKIIVVFLATVCAALAQQAKVSGELSVDGKPVKFTNVYSFMTQGFYDKEKSDTVVLLTNAPLKEEEFRDENVLRKLTRDGKLSFIKESINDLGQIVNYTIGHPSFRMAASGASSDHVFEGKADGKAVNGKVLTKITQRTPDGHKYVYSATFNAPTLVRKDPGQKK